MHNKEIIVKNSGIVQLQFFKDYPDGDLFIASQKNIGFEIKRVYFINNFANRTAIRGQHAHKKLHQVIFCINGSFTLCLDDGLKKQTIVLDAPLYGVILGPELWHEMTAFSKDCVILVFASDYYEENDYVRTYDEFIKSIKGKHYDSIC